MNLLNSKTFDVLSVAGIRTHQADGPVPVAAIPNTTLMDARQCGIRLPHTGAVLGVDINGDGRHVTRASVGHRMRIGM